MQTQPAYSLLYQPEGLAAVPAENEAAAVLDSITPSLPKPLNSEQADALISSFCQRVSLVWGPPGTGKTTVVATAILGWLQRAIDNDSPICVGVGSNTWDAIDLVLHEVAELIDSWALQTKQDFSQKIGMARVRSDYANPGPDLKRIQDVPRFSAAANKLVSEMRSLSGRSLVIGGTWQQLSKLAGKGGSNPIPKARWFDLLVIDEASQVKVSSAAAYYLLLKTEGHVVLAGDDKQLGPILAFEVQDTHSGLLDSVYSYVAGRQGVHKTQLRNNYRTNSEIAEWPKRRFYTDYRAMFPGRRLVMSLPSSRPADWPDKQLVWDNKWAAILDPTLPIVVVTYPPQPYTLANPFEAHAVAAVATLLRLSLGTGSDLTAFWENDLAVVTPHRAQVAAVRKLLLSIRPLFSGAAPKVDTVDRIQGDQRAMLLACYSVADKDFVANEEEFIMDPRRFNVTLTRAQSKFVLFISESLLQYLPSDLELAKSASHLQMFIADYCQPIGGVFSLPFVENNVSKQMNGCRLRACSVAPDLQ